LRARAEPGWPADRTMRSRTVWRGIGALAVLAVLGFAVFWLVTAPSTLPAKALAADYKPDIANGETLFTIGGCVSCHKTPGQDDRLYLGGGLGLASPFGTFYAPNISPDPQHGLGRWSELDFVDAILRGVGPEGQHLYPALPYTSYQRMSVKDARDLFAYLKTLQPVAEPSKAHDIPFPFNIRRLLGGWKFLYLDEKPFVPDPSKSAAWNRGAYLVEGPGHCAECHSPRNALGAIVADRRFSGGPDPEGKGFVPNITPSEDGIKAWSEADIAEFLKSGLTPSFDSAGGSMAEVIQNTSRLSDADRAAIATYLVSLPPLPGKAPKKAGP
jgi:mono/diheme cytochrome c family protein